MLPEPIAVTFLVIEALDKLGIPYMVGGSLASAVYGVTRSTLDADIVAKIGLEHAQPLTRALEQEFYVDEEMIRGAVEHHSSFNVIHLKTSFKVDFFVLKQRPFDQVQLDRRISQVFATDPERKAYICSPEDIVLAKLEWYRMGGEVSDRQWRDILGVLKLQADYLDRNYLKKWAGELNVVDILQKALNEAGLN